MQIIIIAVVATLVLMYGSKKVLAFMHGANESLHAWNVKRRGEKEAEKLKREQEDEVATWQAHCRDIQEQERRRGEASRVRRVGADGSAGEIILFEEDDCESDAPVSAAVLAAETV